MTPDQVDALAVWLCATLHRMDPAQFKLTAEQAAARLKTLPQPAEPQPADANAVGAPA